MSNQNPIAKMAEHIGDAPVPPMVGVGAIALQMAMQFHDISTIKDGALYQQFKLEGRNIETLGLADVFETAVKIEAHLMGTSDRIAGIVVDALQQGIVAEDEARDIFEAAIVNIINQDTATVEELNGYFLENRDALGDEEAALKALVEHLDNMDVSEEQTMEFLGDRKKSVTDAIIKAIFDQYK